MGWKALAMAAFWLGATLVSCTPRHVVQIETPDKYQYTYLEDHGVTVNSYYITFLLRASNDGVVTLSSYKGNKNSYEIDIGGWGNSQSVIRRCHQCANMVEVEHSLGILNNEELLPFWISWAHGHIRVGRGTELYNEQFMSWTDSDPHQINHVGISTGFGSSGTWIFVVDCSWSILEPWLSHLNTSVLQDNDDTTCLSISDSIHTMTLAKKMTFNSNFAVDVFLSPDTEHLRSEVLRVFTSTDLTSPGSTCQLSGPLSKCKHTSGATYACKCTSSCRVYVKVFQPGLSTLTATVCDIGF